MGLLLLQFASSALIVLYILLLGAKKKSGLPMALVANLVFLVNAIWSAQWGLVPLPLAIAVITIWNWTQWDKRK